MMDGYQLHRFKAEVLILIEVIETFIDIPKTPVQ